jgi:hypothetical protein
LAFVGCRSVPESADTLINLKLEKATAVFVKCNDTKESVLEILVDELMRVGLYDVQPYGNMEVAVNEKKVVLDITYSMTFVGLAYANDGQGPKDLLIKIIDVDSNRTLAHWEYLYNSMSLDKRDMRSVLRNFTQKFGQCFVE